MKTNLFDTAGIQRLQMLNLILLMAIGKFILEIPITWFEIISIVLFGVFIDHLLIYVKHKQLLFFSYASVSTSLGVVFLLRSVDLYVYLLVLLIALAQKYFIKIDKQHFLNPSNVAVVSGLALFSYQTYTTPGQWGSYWWLGLMMVALGLFITSKVNRVWITISFMLFYTLLSYLFITHNLYEIATTLISGSFLLFIFFMLTDPRATPDRLESQVLFALLISTLTILLELIIGLKDVNMFLALFMVSFLVPLFRVIEKKDKQIVIYPIIYIVTIAIVALFYASEYNIIRNIERSADSGTLHTSKETPFKIMNNDKINNQQTDPLQIWKNEQPQWYKKSWDDSSIVISSIERQIEGKKGFIKFTNAIKNYHKPIDNYHFGMDWMHNSAITAGDINHDGLMDVVLSKIDEPIKIFINQGQNSFVDATQALFTNEVPFDAEQIALADFNNDSWLDIIVLFNRYDRPELNHKIYFFDADKKQFNYTYALEQNVTSSTGGIALYDLNNDRILDVYLTNSRDWRTPRQKRHGFLHSTGTPDQLWISNGESWIESAKETMDVVSEGYAGMTALFSDFNGDGNVDFLLGNDAQPDITMLGRKDAPFSLIDKDTFAYNSQNSMSYFSIDMDNDGKFEIWENGISQSVRINKNRSKDLIGKSVQGSDSFSLELSRLRKSFGRGDMQCDSFNGLLKILCTQKKASYIGIRLGQETQCDKIRNPSQREICGYLATRRTLSHRSDPRKFKYKAERFAKKISKNILLKQDSSGVYNNVLHNFDAQLTGWSWAAYPYDVNNDGLLDLYITTGSIHTFSRVANALLINESGPNKISLKNRASEYGVDTLEGSRGTIISDFDRDGDGDIIVNTPYASPIYYENRSGGDSISISLRSRFSNYYAIGSRIELHTNKGIQTREVRVGGIWNSYQSSEIHFGVASEEKIKYLKIIWPNKDERIIKTLKVNNHYCVYE